MARPACSASALPYDIGSTARARMSPARRDPCREGTVKEYRWPVTLTKYGAERCSFASTSCNFVLAGAASVPSALRSARAQTVASPPAIGFLSLASRDGHPQDLAEFCQGLRALGYVEGRTAIIEERFANGRVERLTALIDDFLQRRVKLVVCPGPSATRLAHAHNNNLSIVGVALPSSYPEL